MGRKTIIFILIGIMILNAGLFMNGNAEVVYANEDDKDSESLLDGLFNNDKKDKKQDETEHANQDGETNSSNKRVIEKSYSDKLVEWQDNDINAAGNFNKVIHPTDFVESNKRLNLTAENKGYNEKVFKWDEETENLLFSVNVPEEGLYEIEADYHPLPNKIIPIERGIKVNGEFQYYESRRIVFPRIWKDEVDKFEQDELGNEIFPNQVEVDSWQTISLMDASYLFDRPLKFHLKKGNNKIELLNIREPMLLGNITVKSPQKLPSYKEYSEKHNEDAKQIETLIEIEAEHPLHKSSSSVRALANGEPNVTPNRGTRMSLNAFGGDTWKAGGDSVTWKINVDKTGFYQLAFKYNQYFKVNMPVYRTIKIDGEVPFNRLLEYPFPYSTNWRNEILSDEKGNPYQFYLTKGEHELTFTANPAPYQPVISTVKEVMNEVSELSLEIKKATGNTDDIYRDWNIEKQIPDIVPRLNKYAGMLREKYKYLEELSGKKPDQARNLMVSAEQLEELAAEPDEIPVRFKELSQSTGSVSQKLGDLLLILPEQSLQFDKFYVYSQTDLPNAEANLFQKIVASTSKFFSSFTEDYNKVSAPSEDAVEIWVNRPRQYVMLMQQLANENFTKETGINVSLSLMPNEEKLILANASDESPDLALGIKQDLPFRLAVRGALADLKQFPDYEQVIDRFSPGALLPFMYDNGTYALPETQEFFVLFYRKDILQALDIPVPDTWEDVQEILPKLQRYGMNFYVPLAGLGGHKELNVTVPYIYQNGGDLYKEDGMTTAIDSEEALKGFKQMTNMFSIYSMPLQVPNFYSHFRQGDIPIGIADFDNYVKITAAAPELQGWWEIAPYPGVKNENGEVSRWAPGTGKGVVMFESSEKKKEAWEFIKWWTSTETQSQFGNMIETIYGTEFRWNTSNVEAISQLPWPDDDLEVIQQQWKWLRDIPRLPGDYMLEREISNAWNEVVFEGENERKAIEDAVITTNRELRKKLEEFGYIEDGKIVEELDVPSLEDFSSKEEAQ
jgi:ABC-type glycerol-3-phosphate transport system substrate-binding protein